MNETINFLIGPILVVIAGLILFLIARREVRRTAAYVERINNDFHLKVDEQIRRLQGMSVSKSFQEAANSAHRDDPLD